MNIPNWAIGSFGAILIILLILLAGNAPSEEKALSNEQGAFFFGYFPLILNNWNPPGPPPRNPEGHCTIPPGAGEEDTSNNRVIGNGTPQSCTSEAIVAAVAQGGIITFNCGPAPVTMF